ncbi:MAG: electron transfer flavoprotein subunit beta/FixA family protein [Clostridiales Family XIII bacterium]|nr:electron transfer flavoprotein subunit beta/FixA family protein [Clostridiales Family XIII bacterium]
MQILVCVKPVPDPEKYDLLMIDPETRRLIREGIPTVINPADKNALEAALRIKDTTEASITVLSMAPDFCADRIRECLAMGADEAYLLSDIRFGGADTYATSRTLMKGIETIGLAPDLILAGNESADGATAHVPVQLAEWLGLPHIANVSSIERDTRAGQAPGAASWIIHKKAEQGHIRYRARPPILLSVERNSNRPRIVSALGVVKSKKKKLEILRFDALDVSSDTVGYAGSPTKAGALSIPDLSRTGQRVAGTPAEIAAAFMDIIKKSI